MGEGCAAGWGKGGLLGEKGLCSLVGELGGEGCAAGREINRLLGGGRAVLLGGREVDC